MSERPDDRDDDEAVQEAAEHAELAGQEREEMTRKASLSGAADDAQKTDELELESEAHGEAAEEQEAASSERAHAAD